MSKLDFITLGLLSVLTNAIPRVLLDRHYLYAWKIYPYIEAENAYYYSTHIFSLCNINQTQNLTDRTQKFITGNNETRCYRLNYSWDAGRITRI